MDRATLVSISAAVWRQRWLTLVVLVLVLGADALITARSPRFYLARSSLLIGPSPNVDRGQLVYSVDALGRALIVGTYADVLATDVVRRDALTRVGVSTDIPDTDIQIKAAALADSALVQVTAEARDPALAAAVANAVGDVGQARMSQVYPIYELTVVTAATPPTAVNRPNVFRNLSLGALLGVVLAASAASAYDALARRRARQTG
jgi:capsular polysaccharide biosynthesis protein